MATMKQVEQRRILGEAGAKVKARKPYHAGEIIQAEQAALSVYASLGATRDIVKGQRKVLLRSGIGTRQLEKSLTNSIRIINKMYNNIRDLKPRPPMGRM